MTGSESVFTVWASGCSYVIAYHKKGRESLRRLYLNEGRHEEAADELLRWVFCNGKRLRGLGVTENG
jgi:GH24 family phage-related lysozyme (muramidase)